MTHDHFSDSDHRRRFFYAEAYAGVYDRTIDLVVPQYRLMHETMIRLLHNHFDTPDMGGRRGACGSVLDIGSGTGTEALRVLQEFPEIHLMAIDLCEPMHQELRRKFEICFGSTERFDSRCSTITGDILGEECSPSRLISAAPSTQRWAGFQAAITAFTIHHLDHDGKREAYRRIFEVLAPGSIFINGDLFSFQSPSLARQAHEFDLEWMAKQFQTPDSEFSEAVTIPKHRREELCRRWISHYTSDNLLEPIEDPNEIEKNLAGQMKMLLDVGFAEVGNPFRYWQAGIIWAKK